MTTAITVLSLTEHCCVYVPQDEYGATPLITACTENRVEVVRLLAERGADINLQNKVHVVTTLISINCVQYYLRNRIIATPLFTLLASLVTQPLLNCYFIHQHVHY